MFLIKGSAKSFYLPSLDGLRFIAFLMIFVFHAYIRVDNSGNILFKVIQKNTWYGVDLFFVLSGFLITLLLLIEREKYGFYSIKNFLIRRALRIWPLFYAGVIAAVFIVPIISNAILKNYNDPQFVTDILTKVPYYLLFLGNWSIILQGFTGFRNLAVLWTIAVEQQFYFIWPIILLPLNTFYKLTRGIILIITASVVYKYYLALSATPPNAIFNNTFARLDTLLLGGLLATIYFYKPGWIKKTNKFTNLITVILAFILFNIFAYNVNVTIYQNVFSVTFGYLIIGLFMVFFVHSAIQVKFLESLLSNKAFVSLGKISYGLYVWHIFVINFFHQVLKSSKYLNYLQPLELGIAIIIGYISYYCFEIQFLKLKTKFTKIRSRKI